jgi:hypothetical protein
MQWLAVQLQKISEESKNTLFYSYFNLAHCYIDLEFKISVKKNNESSFVNRIVFLLKTEFLSQYRTVANNANKFFFPIL